MMLQVGMAVRGIMSALDLLGYARDIIKSYQSQVIPTAVQRCNHHLLINNPYWREEGRTKEAVLKL